MAERSIVYFGPGRPAPTTSVAGFARDWGLQLYQVRSEEQVSSTLNRSFPACLVLDARAEPARVLELCRSVKGDAFRALVPVVIQVAGEGRELLADALEAGADEVVGEVISDREIRLRLELVLRRAERDVSVHPTTRLPGTVKIERDLMERMARSEAFAVCLTCPPETRPGRMLGSGSWSQLQGGQRWAGDGTRRSRSSRC